MSKDKRTLEVTNLRAKGVEGKIEKLVSHKEHKGRHSGWHGLDRHPDRASLLISEESNIESGNFYFFTSPTCFCYEPMMTIPEQFKPYISSLLKRMRRFYRLMRLRKTGISF